MKTKKKKFLETILGILVTFRINEETKERDFEKLLYVGLLLIGNNIEKKVFSLVLIQPSYKLQVRGIYIVNCCQKPEISRCLLHH